VVSVVKLIEVFNELEAKATSTAQNGKYAYERVFIPRRYPKPLDKVELIKYVESLQKKYPKKGFSWSFRRVKGRWYFVIRRKPAGYKNPSLYIDLHDGRWYIPASYVRRKPKLCSFIAFMRAQDLLEGRVKTVRKL